MKRSSRVDGPVRAAIVMDDTPGSMQTKRASIIEEAAADDRRLTQEGLRGLDDMVELASNLSRAQKDRERAIPREMSLPLGHPAKDRPLLEPDAVRVPFSQRQRQQRLHTMGAVWSDMKDAEYRSMDHLLRKPGEWQRLNGSLAEHVGDATQLSTRQQADVRRIDRTIQTYEQQSDRAHRVYANLTLPPAINRSNIKQFLGGQLEPGSTVYFDQYTFANHNLNEISQDGEYDPQRTVTFEIHTRRGMYAGQPGASNQNGHLLPRGMELEIAGIHEVTFQNPDGTRGTRLVIQAHDMSND